MPFNRKFVKEGHPAQVLFARAMSDGAEIDNADESTQWIRARSYVQELYDIGCLSMKEHEIYELELPTMKEVAEKWGPDGTGKNLSE